MRVFLLHSNEPTLQLLLDKIRLPHGTRLPVSQEPTCIIHWGCFHAEKSGRRSVQPVKSVLRAANPRKAAECLELHGIRMNPETGAELPRWTYEYVIPVFHLQALALFQKSHGVYFGTSHPLQKKQEDSGFVEVLAETPSYHAIRAKREAVKAIYALGLDYGVVRVGVRPGGELTVLEVGAVPQLDERLAELFADAMHKLALELKEEAEHPLQEAMLGADPEFLLLNERGKVIFASDFLEKDGPVGCDAIVLPSFRKIYPLAELRPEPSREVRQMMINLHRTMQLASRSITDGTLEWVAGGMPVKGFPLGGHIHFSGVRLSAELLRTLDNYLALPLVLLEDETTGGRRPKYGFLGDFRRQRHGGFEYRVLPSWMTSPTVARGVLALAKLIADHHRLLPARPLGEPNIQQAYYSGDKPRIRPLIPGLWSDMVKLPGFRKHEAYLTPLKTMLLQMKGWNEQEDIRRKWKIGPFHRKEPSSMNS
ncbi:hypothetical protein N0M98_30580 [Paenibacillus doosanensis]|uniref:putative amidoligase domain-containing protein n=1 Tax=Paenibacillus doosanensis TaxID=1229154 RepID=UPI00217FBF2B|nr:hypothetical protein [Paenibacillus doosanensis]MCS7464448.1 hypothetical protein [Paenibacillus doosanensis]